MKSISFHWPRIALCLVSSLALGSVITTTAAESNTPEPKVFRAGAATSVITPPLGEKIVGGFAPFPATNIHDELHARCLVLDDGSSKVVFVVCDLLGIHRSVGVEAKALIEKELGIPASHVAISATHTHSATNALYGDLRTYNSDVELTDYQRFVARRIADGVRRAAHHLRPAEMAYGSVDIPEHVFNRRWFLKEGTMPENPFGKTDEKVKMNPQAGSDTLVEPAGPTDPRVSILVFREPGGKPIALYSAYSLHYIGGVKGADVSADYYGYYCRDVEKALGQAEQDPPFVAMMANGTSGDINNVNFREPRPSRKPYEHMKYVANDIAEKVTGAVASFAWKSDITLDARYEELANVKWREVPKELLDWGKKTFAEIPADVKDMKLIMRRVYSQRVQTLSEASSETKFPVHAVRIGDVCIGMTPCETFAEMGMEFREKSPFKKSFMVELTDGYYGYMPTPRHFELGGYETWPATNCLEPQAAVKTLDAILSLSREMVPPRPTK